MKNSQTKAKLLIATHHLTRRLNSYILFILFMGGLCLPTITNAQPSEFDLSRVRAGLKVFRSMLMADRDITTKSTSDNEINIVFIYNANMEQAESLAHSFVRMGKQETQGKIKGSLIKVHILKELDTITKLALAPAGIFVLEPIPDEMIQNIINYGKAHHVVTFSPYQGDVEKGVLGGLEIETRVRPFINTHTLQVSELRIKSFFLKAAKIYEK
ncbi:hypothetical protein KIH87_07365 [Paraneptunicella aestuarii]|uniref:hypothetical protein n=1 Tax=Paraneptunicella aestuarii TaxID=2831148 RepID=UPI001E53D7CD|nr:hypothetical protein [Paraneptunicella aestuarii]UAA40157.1 hypothetical protein KIH87_07365 [Paraneptunicella aestuarii]